MLRFEICITKRNVNTFGKLKNYFDLEMFLNLFEKILFVEFS